MTSTSSCLRIADYMLLKYRNYIWYLHILVPVLTDGIEISVLDVLIHISVLTNFETFPLRVFQQLVLSKLLSSAYAMSRLSHTRY